LRSGTWEEPSDRPRSAAVLDYVEFFLNAAVAFALGIGGVILFVVVVYEFVHGLGHGPFIGRLISLLSGLLLVFIFTELINTLRIVIATHEVQVEPFLVVGIVAAIRRVIVVGAEVENTLGTPRFRDVMLEIGVLTGTVLTLGVTVFLLRAARAREDETAPGKDGDRGRPEARRPAG
jgi:uncharacterized membrane protein (DUF373 family)